MDAAQSDEQSYSIRQRVMMLRKRNKVLYVEAGKDFVDALFSFLTLPLGTITTLVSKVSNIEAAPFGSLSSLYQSIAGLDEQHLRTPTCREMLPNPRNSMDACCHQLKLNIDDTQPMQYFHSENRNSNRSRLESGFVKENATFIVSDDLYVMPNVFKTIAHLHQKHKITNFEAIVEQSVEITKKEVVDILKLSLTSKKPLTDFIFKKKHFPVGHKNRNQTEFKIREKTSDKGRQMSVKVVRQKSTGKILFAEAGVDFIDFVFSFQTFPLGGVLHMLEGDSSLECIDNLYKSVAMLSADISFMSQNMKELRKPLVKSCFVGADTSSCMHKGYHGNSFLPLKLVDATFSASNSLIPGKFVKCSSMLMVTDDLVVTPMSSFDAISYLNSLNVHLLDVEERVVKIGLKEGLSILKASLTSTSALTNALSNVLKSRSLRLRTVILIVFVSFAIAGHIVENFHIIYKGDHQRYRHRPLASNVRAFYLELLEILSVFQV